MSAPLPAEATARRPSWWEDRAGRVSAGLAGTLGALGLLTAFPLPGTAHRRPSASTLAGFAGAGLLLGGALAGVDAALAPLLPRAPRDAVLLGALALLSGGMHLDGLADCADGLLLTGATAERRLAVMRDSSTGAFGVAAVALVLLTDLASLGTLGVPRLQALVVAVTASRAAAALALGVSVPARTEGLAHACAVPGRAAAAAVAALAALVTGVLLLGVRGLVAVAAALLVAPAAAAVLRRRVGGMTGDGCGAVIEVGLTMALLCLCARP
jgi:adenosylcobinamide-GDP ribazoletransferase